MTSSRGLCTYSICLTLAISVIGCDRLLSDPAVRIAECVEAGATRLSSRASSEVVEQCDTRQDGEYVVVFYPRGTIEEEALVAGGVPRSLVGTLRRLRIADLDAIYVIPLRNDLPSSRTTYQGRFALTPQLRVVKKSNAVLFIRFRKGTTGIMIDQAW